MTLFTIPTFAAAALVGSLVAVLSGDASQAPPPAIGSPTPLAVALRAADGACVGTGLIVGHDENRVFVATVGLVPKRSSGDGPLLGIGHRPKHVTLPTTIVKVDPSFEVNLAVLSVGRAEFLKAVGAMPAFDVLGDPPGLLRRDRVMPVICTPDGTELRRARPVLQTGATVIAYQGGDLPEAALGSQPPAEGGPLMWSLGRHQMVVGLTTVSRSRAEATNIAAVLERIRAWGVPVALAAPASAPGCRYAATFSRGPSQVSGGASRLFFPGRGSITVTVDTTPQCGWAAFVDDSGWLGIADTAPGGMKRVTGPGTVTFQVVKSNTCSGALRDGVLYVAGTIYRTQQDGTNAGVGC